MAKKKKVKLSTLRTRIDRILHKVIYLRDSGTCQKCGVQNSRMEASHIYPKGKHQSMRYLLLNVKLLCHTCHRWWHEHPLESGEWIKEYLGERYDGLVQRSRESHSVNEFTLLEDEERLKESLAYWEGKQ